MDTYTDKELAALKDLRHRIDDVNLDWFYGHNYHLFRWLKARDMNVEKAEQMLRKNLEWRNQKGIDQILSKPLTESLIRDFPFQVLGFDDNQDLIAVLPYGQWDFRSLVEQGKKGEIFNFIYYNIELAYKFARNRCTKDRISSKITIILNLENFSLRTILHKPTIEFFLEIVQTLEDNYPEILKGAYMVNCPKIFECLWTLAKPLLSMRTLNKFQIFGSNPAWRTKLLKSIPAHCLPSNYGGSQTTVPNISFYHAKLAKLDLTTQEINITLEQNQPFSEDKLTKVEVEANNKFQHVVRMPPKGGVLRWAFKTDDHDIGFRLFNATGDKVVEVNRADAHRSMQLGTFKCSASGSYVFSFDNSYARVPKTLYYKVELCESEGK